MKYYLIVFIILMNASVQAQSYEYEVSLEAISIEGLGGIHSYAYAQLNGEWLIVGGRLDGLHRRQPFAAFDESGNNTQAIVVNPETKQIWKAAYTELPIEVKEQLSSTNMQFYQDGEYLIITGGYSYSTRYDDHITFPRITAMYVQNVIEGVKNNSISPSSIISKEDQKFAVTGGRLEKIEDDFYLIGGHRFDGPYNPMGPDQGPGFKQEYTNEIRPFSLNVKDQEIQVVHHSAIHDEMNLHRRDYNLVPQIRKGEEELMIFSGVFQNLSNVPWLYPVQVGKNDYMPIPDFLQSFNHYHCAAIPIYNASNDEMHTIFFGGIAQFYMDEELLVQDNDIPFVNTIADVSRDKNGNFQESKLGTEMPDFIGSATEFIVNRNSPMYNQRVIDGDEIGTEFTSIGYIYGGIKSSMPHIFFENEGELSVASNTVYKVLIRKVKSSDKRIQSKVHENILVYPRPSQKVVRVSIFLETLSDIEIKAYTSSGELVGSETILQSDLTEGQNFLALENLNVGYGAYLYEFRFDDKLIRRKVIWTE